MQKIILIICCLFLVNDIPVQEKNANPLKCANSSLLFVGTVLDSNQAAISEATIYVQSNNEKNKTTKLQSDQKGQFKICLPEGTYQFLVSAAGFKNLLLQNHKLNSAISAKFEFKLEPGQCNDCGEWFPTSQSNQ